MSARRHALDCALFVVMLFAILAALCAVDPCDINPSTCSRTSGASATQQTTEP
jgi:hypothetical protein